MLFQPILDFDNLLKEGTKNVNERKVSIIKNIKQMNSVLAVQPTYLLKRGLLLRKILIIMLKF